MKSEMSGREGMLRSYILLCLSIAPPTAGLGWYTWPVLATWVAIGGVRLRYADSKLKQDCLLFGLVNIFLLRGRLHAIIEKSWNELTSLKDQRSLLATLVTVTLALVIRRAYSKNECRDESPVEISEGLRKWSLDYPKPLIFPCRTTHARVFPKRHAFGYKYLLCGFPIIPAGTATDGTTVGDGKDRRLGNWWLHVKADDYLERGYGGLGFYGKLKKCLRDRNVHDTDWAYAYLVTAPRFFGYSFNPVSFWYIYNHDHQLKKMILEVNNTFGERRIYLLDGSSPPSPPRTPESEPSVPESTKDRFTDIWMKDFHVSPFNSRKGAYSLKALNLFPRPDYPNPSIDNTITMKSSKDHAKIVACIHTTGKAIDPNRISLLGTLRFIGGWWWVGFMTFPRILKEAFRLYFWRKLHVWFRPEVLSSSVGRIPTPIEEALQKPFEDYLNHLVHQSPTEAFWIDCHTAIPDRPQQVVKTTHERGRDRNFNRLEIRVTTPVFYSRFVHYAHTSEAFDRECLFTDEKNRTLWISQPEVLPKLLPRSRSVHVKDGSLPVKRSYLDELRWNLLRKLRCPPPEPAYSVTPKSAEFDIGDIRMLPFSDLDNFVRSRAGSAYAGAYRRLATKIFLAQRFALGLVEIIDFLDFILRLMLCWIGSRKLLLWAQEVEDRSGGDFRMGLQQGKLPFTSLEWWWMSGTIVYLSACHMYGLLKGYK